MIKEPSPPAGELNFEPLVELMNNFAILDLWLLELQDLDVYAIWDQSALCGVQSTKRQTGEHESIFPSRLQFLRAVSALSVKGAPPLLNTRWCQRVNLSGINLK